MRQSHATACVIVTISLVLGARVARGQQPLDLAVLRSRGLDAYAQLPEKLTLRDGSTFAEALMYLYAYEQRVSRRNGRISGEDQAAIDWLTSNIDVLRAGKADGEARPDDELLSRGMSKYKKAKQSDDGRVWDVPAYLSASANLYAYLQCVKDPKDEAKNAFSWIVKAKNRLVIAGGKADGPFMKEWLPGSPRPGARGLSNRPSIASVAFRKRSVQSSTAFGGIASRAVDGNTDGYWLRNSVTHTDSSAASWWMVDLGSEHRIDSVVVYNRRDCCGQRLHASVAVTATEGWPSVSTQFMRPLGPPRDRLYLSVSSQTWVFGRFVYVLLDVPGYLSLAEVEVYGVPR
jgi:hypothetical protein